jgi:nucleotide-binding universal stress UspA family protein
MTENQRQEEGPPVFTHIMVPVDLAHADRLTRALEAAADLAKSHDARITYVGVTAPQPGQAARSPEDFAEKLAQFAATQAEAMGIAETGTHPIISHDPSVELDRALKEAADSLGADLIVMGSHIPRAFDLKSHGGHLAQMTDRSILLIRDPQS